MKDLAEKGHIVTMDNFFTLVPLFLDWLEKGIIATETLRMNQTMFANYITKNQDMGWLDYCMHEERKLYCVVWKDKQVVLLLSTHAELSDHLGVDNLFVGK